MEEKKIALFRLRKNGKKKQSICPNSRRGSCDIKNTNFVEKNFKETEILHFEILKNKIGKIEFKLNSV